MARVTLEIQGMNKLKAALAEFGEDAARHVGDAVNATGLALRKDIMDRYKTPKSGRVYTHYYFTGKSGQLQQGRKRNKPHQASAPGEAPAVDGGQLRGRVDYERTGAMSATVGSSVVYGAMLEWGTSKIAPRPAWVPAVEDMREKFNDRIEAALARAMK